MSNIYRPPILDVSRSVKRPGRGVNHPPVLTPKLKK
jgi:hypothetical protein